MFGRFKVRPDTEAGQYGVWDGGSNGWRGRGLPEAAAHQLAADLELPVPPRATRLAQGTLTSQGEIVDPFEDDEAISGEPFIGESPG